MLAIIVPYYKNDFFEKTLHSLAKQTNKNFTLYVGNDDSPNKPESLIDKYKSDFNLEYRKFPNNLGRENLVEQWRRCINLIHHEDWFIILGDDDYLSENYVEEFYKFLPKIEKEKVNVVKVKSIIVDHNEMVLYNFFGNEDTGIKSSLDLFNRKEKGRANSSLSEHIFRTSRYKEVGFVSYPLAWHSDDMAILKFSNFSNIFFIDTALCYVRQSSQSISGNENNLRDKNLASLHFYSDLVKSTSSKFEKDQIKSFLSRIEYLSSITGTEMSQFLCKHSLKNKLFTSFLQFTKKYILVKFRYA